jgi:drug/metabolite transporter (DMT)-like permease
LKYKLSPIFQAILAAVLFGASAPFAKMFLGDIQPIPLASFLYLGSGIGMLVFWILQRFQRNYKRIEATIKKEDVKWLIGAVLTGGFIAPIILMYSLKHTPASTASVLLNFEGVSTTLIAMFVFKEAIGKRVWAAIAFITAASILLSWNFTGGWGFSISALGVVMACVMWGLDNNFTRSISSKDPVVIVIIKGLGAGSFSLLLSICLHNSLPSLKMILGAMLLGFICYGLSIVLFIRAMRTLGASRACAFLGTAPFLGALFSFVLFRETAGTLFFVSLPIMMIGAALLLNEKHSHKHLHETLDHEHRHSHTDEHHNHEQNIEASLEHTHLHSHEVTEHTHPHTPDIHHRHIHQS